ncbi:MAG: hypothetical protein KGK30_00545 [Elusimicrobia bacterium]|nr:hypothetical protein [Elusimicrobiota bacterium]
MPLLSSLLTLTLIGAVPNAWCSRPDAPAVLEPTAALIGEPSALHPAQLLPPETLPPWQMTRALVVPGLPAFPDPGGEIETLPDTPDPGADFLERLNNLPHLDSPRVAAALAEAIGPKIFERARGGARTPESAQELARRLFDGVALSRPFEARVSPGERVERLWHADGSPVDSAVELEIPLDLASVRLLTTVDGTIGSLLETTPLPDSISLRLSGFGDPIQNLELPWDALTAEEQRALIVHAAARQDANFENSRRIEGLRTRKNITISIAQPTILFGVLRQTGVHQIDVSRILESHVEFVAHSDTRNLKHIELHLRSNFRAGQMSEEAWNFADAAGLTLNHLHVHVVRPLPSLASDAQALAYALAAMERQRRL